MNNIGLVIRSTGSWYTLLDQKGELRQGRLRGKLKLKGYKVTNPLAVGDRVFYKEEDTAENTVVIYKIDKRTNCIIRKSPQRNHLGHIIAANIDRAIVIATLVDPITSTGFIDRFLVAAQSYHIPACILFNKQDLYNDEVKELQQHLRDKYHKIGYDTLCVSALTGEGTKELTNYLQDKTTLFTGHSGVGKSTLVNQLSNNRITQKTQEVSHSTGKGLHTTTFSEMFEVNQNSFIIDTPGIREFGIQDIKEGELRDYFPEFLGIQAECKYNNCTHIHEPQCVIKDAVNAGEIDHDRYYSYLNMYENFDSRG